MHAIPEGRRRAIELYWSNFNNTDHATSTNSLSSLEVEFLLPSLICNIKIFIQL